MKREESQKRQALGPGDATSPASNRPVFTQMREMATLRHEIVTATGFI